MDWVIREDVHFSGPYRILHQTRGWSVWHYEKTSSCLGREVHTLEAAKGIAERHLREQQHVW